MYNTNRAVDSCAERFITKWLTEHYFSKLFSKYEIIEDRDRQLAGIDVIGDGINYDIKAQSSKKYLNNPTNTFSVEISFYNRNYQELTGWFINPNLDTQSYIFMWVPQCEHCDGIIADIETAEILIVDKQALVSGVAAEFKSHSCGTTAMQYANEMREGDIRSRWCGDNLKFVYSNHLAEEPVNIVLQKEFLKRYSIRHDLVTKNGITPI